MLIGKHNHLLLLLLNYHLYNWANENAEVNNNGDSRFNETSYEKVQLTLSDKFMGYSLIPDNEVWNYNFIVSDY